MFQIKCFLFGSIFPTPRNCSVGHSYAFPYAKTAAKLPFKVGHIHQEHIVRTHGRKTTASSNQHGHYSAPRTRVPSELPPSLRSRPPPKHGRFHPLLAEKWPRYTMRLSASPGHRRRTNSSRGISGTGTQGHAIDVRTIEAAIFTHEAREMGQILAHGQSDQEPGMRPRHTGHRSRRFQQRR